MKLSTILCTGVLMTAASLAAVAHSDRTEAELLAEIERRADATDDALIFELAAFGTPSSLDGLLRVYDGMFSVYMRREILRAISGFTGGQHAPIAFTKMTEVAIGSPSVELRHEAVDLLAIAGDAGKAQLAYLVESTADEDVRGRALRAHAARIADDDEAWYRKLYGRAEPKKGEEPTLASLRLIAFEGMLSRWSVNELADALEDRIARVRLRALEELARRGDKRTDGVAEKLARDQSRSASDRLYGAELMIQLRGPRAAKPLTTLALKAVTPEQLADGIADLLVELADPAVDKTLLRKLGKGREHEKLFYIRATRTLQDPRMERAYRQLLGDRSPRVVLRVIQTMGDRRDVTALPALEGILAEGGNPMLQAEALSAIAKIREGDADLSSLLVEQLEHPEPQIRGAAVKRIASAGRSEFEPMLIKALSDDDWSIRLTAAAGIERLGSVEGVGALCMRIGEEQGRMVHDFAAILWRMTGEPFGPRARLWQAWWKDKGADFEVIDAATLARKETELEERELRRVTRTMFTDPEARSVFLEDEGVFFGMRLISDRVTFVLDISGSMSEAVATDLFESKPTTRMDLAVREIDRALGSLQADAEFNLILFGNGATRWSDEPLRATPENVAAARKYLEDVPIGMATNLYSGLEAAFQDRGVDTIYLVTDGEPSTGVLIDPWAIRNAVMDWNDFRGVKIHCIAVGLDYPLLEWLAEDTGGSYASFD